MLCWPLTATILGGGNGLRTRFCRVGRRGIIRYPRRGVDGETKTEFQSKRPDNSARWSFGDGLARAIEWVMFERGRAANLSPAAIRRLGPGPRNRSAVRLHCGDIRPKKQMQGLVLGAVEAAHASVSRDPRDFEPPGYPGSGKPTSFHHVLHNGAGPRVAGHRMSHILYRLYERRLRRQIRAGLMPEHVGLIRNGNRRYARKQGFTDPARAYEMGAQKLDEVLLWCNELPFPFGRPTHSPGGAPAGAGPTPRRSGSAYGRSSIGGRL